MKGAIVNYVLTDADVTNIRRQREQTPENPFPRGEPVGVGEIYPMIVTTENYGDVAIHGTVNGQVFLDGPDTLWVRNIPEGARDQPGYYHQSCYHQS